MVAVVFTLLFWHASSSLVVTWECWVLGTGPQNISERGHTGASAGRGVGVIHDVTVLSRAALHPWWPRRCWVLLALAK